MLLSRILKAEPAISQPNLLAFLERGPIDRQDLFVHFKAAYPDGKINVDGARGGHLDQMLRRLERAGTVCLSHIEENRDAPYGSATSRSRVIVSLPPPEAAASASRKTARPPPGLDAAVTHASPSPISHRSFQD